MALEIFRLGREQSPRLICLVGPFEWLWNLSIEVNQFFISTGSETMCVPVFGEEIDFWGDYVKQSKLQFIGMCLFSDMKFPLVECQLFSREGEVWRRLSQSEEFTSDSILQQSGLDVFLRMIEFWRGN
jgi:hypothetical protein